MSLPNSSIARVRDVARSARAWLCLSLVALTAAGCGASPAPPVKKPDKHPFGAIATTLDAGRWLSEESQRAAAAGASQSEIIAVEAGALGDRISGMLSLPKDACALLIARATDSVEDIDLFVYGDDGTVYGSDEAPDRTPSLLVCPPHTGRFFVAARIAAGQGLVAIGAQLVSVEDAERVGKAVGAKNRPGEAVGRIESWPGLDERINRHRRMVGAHWQDVRRVALPVDARVSTRVSAVVEAKRCLDILVVPAEEVSHLDVTVLDRSGRIVGRGAAVGRDRALLVCSPTKSPVTLEIRPHAGRGLAVLALSRSAEGTEGNIDDRAPRFDLMPSDELFTLQSRHAAALEDVGYGEPTVVAQGSLEVGKRTRVNVKLLRGCSRIDVLAAAPVRALEAWLWDAKGQLLAHDRGATATLFACGAGGNGRLDLEALTLPGRFRVELRQERELPAVLEQHPLAASRLLSRMLRRGVIRKGDQVGKPHLVELSPTRLESLDLVIPVDRCVEVTLSLGPSAAGAEVRLVEKGTEEELALARGTESASVRGCALERNASIHARAEFRVVAGSTKGLVTTRMLAPKP